LTSLLPVCPHLGLSSDPSLIRTEPDEAHRCYAQIPPGEPDQERQQAYCFGSEHVNCPFYIAPRPEDSAIELEDDIEFEGRNPWQLLYIAALGVALLAIAFIYARPFLFPATQESAATPLAFAGITPTTATPFPSVAPTPAILPPTPYATPTPEPGGRVIRLSPTGAAVAWWESADARRARVGDSYLYAGAFENRVFVSAFQLDLTRVPRGAPLRSATLRLTGLDAERFLPEAEGVWTLSLLANDEPIELTRADFQSILNAPAAVTLAPGLAAADLAPHRVNSWELDEAALKWLEQQLLDGLATVTVRIIGPIRGERALFSWDSGAGPASGGSPPELILALGPPPATPPPLPTQPLVVATLTPTPANVLTVAANLLTATAIVKTIGALTPTPANVATPTPIPANLATVQAIAFLSGLPPVVEHTPPAKNKATAVYRSQYATAVALTTGTFTPVPTDAVTPVYITATPTPANLATAVAYVLTATAQARSGFTPTPWPYNALIPTPTFTPWYITPTPTPASAATATAQSFYATAVALTTGTFTPLPPNTIILGGAGTPVPELYSLGERAVVSAAQAVNLRAGPGLEFETVGLLEPGAVVEIIAGPRPDDQYIWWRVRFAPPEAEPLEGWLAGFLLGR